MRKEKVFKILGWRRIEWKRNEKRKKSKFEGCWGKRKRKRKKKRDEVKDGKEKKKKLGLKNELVEKSEIKEEEIKFLWRNEDEGVEKMKVEEI